MGRQGVVFVAGKKGEAEKERGGQDKEGGTFC